MAKTAIADRFRSIAMTVSLAPICGSPAQIYNFKVVGPPTEPEVRLDLHYRYCVQSAAACLDVNPVRLRNCPAEITITPKPSRKTTFQDRRS